MASLKYFSLQSRLILFSGILFIKALGESIRKVFRQFLRACTIRLLKLLYLTWRCVRSHVHKPVHAQIDIVEWKITCADKCSPPHTNNDKSLKK